MIISEGIGGAVEKGETIPSFSFDKEKLLAFAKKHQKDYAKADPFPHIVIDNFFDAEILDKILAEFPDSKQIKWQKFNDGEEKKLATNKDSKINNFTSYVLSQLNSSAFLEFIETLTGIPSLIPDPHYEGGGLHQIQPGGFLKVHADFNWYKRMKIDRRVNILIYLNKDWEEDYKGHLQLWDKDMKNMVEKVLPIFNRCVIFSTTSHSYHGHPETLMCPEGNSRKSLALYYYSNGRPEGEVNSPHTTLFKERPGERNATSAQKKVARLLPPVVVDFLQKFRK